MGNGSKKTDYLKRLEDSLADAYNIVDNTIMYITQEYDNKMSFHVELSELYRLRKEYNQLIKKNEARKLALKKIYHAALERLDKCNNLPDSDLNKYLYDIRNEFRGNLPEGVKYSKVLTWRKANVIINNKEYKNMVSRINNLAAFTSKRMIEAKKTHQKLFELIGYYIIRNAMDALNTTLEYDKIYKLIVDCTNDYGNIRKKLKNGKEEFANLIKDYEKCNLDKLSLEDLQKIDKRIIDIFMAGNVTFLNDRKKHYSLNAVYRAEQPNISKKVSNYKKKVERIKQMVLRNLYHKYEDLENILLLNNKKTNVLGNKTGNLSLPSLIKLDKKVTEELVSAKKEFIHNNYLNIIYFYASNDILGKMPSVIYDVYTRFCEDESTFDICFSVIKEQYNKCYYNTYYDLIIDGDKEYINRAVVNLRDNVDKIVNKYMNLGIDISKDLMEIYKDKEKIDVILLYELYEKLKRNMNLFNINSEIKFGK